MLIVIRGFTTDTENSRENKVDRKKQVSADIQKNVIYMVGKDNMDHQKVGYGISRKKLPNSLGDEE